MNRRWHLIVLRIVILLGLLLSSCAAPAPLPTGPEAEWNLVIIGDSSMWEHGVALEKQIENDMGVEVALFDCALPSLSAGQVLQALETGKSPNLRLEQLPDALREAEFVIMFVNPQDSINPGKPLDLDGCFSSMQPGDCSMESFTGYIADLKAIWANIFELRKGKSTILVATDIYNPLVSNWNQAGIYDACNACWSNMSAAARQAAEAYNIPFASRYDLFNGTSHSEDPREKGYISDDGEHPTQLGAEQSAKLFAELGYEPVLPPK